jgi:DNA-directed RNA polymerase subunit RPC12/RpoP
MASDVSCTTCGKAWTWDGHRYRCFHCGTQPEIEKRIDEMLMAMFSGERDDRVLIPRYGKDAFVAAIERGLIAPGRSTQGTEGESS